MGRGDHESGEPQGHEKVPNKHRAHEGAHEHEKHDKSGAVPTKNPSEQLLLSAFRKDVPRSLPSDKGDFGFFTKGIGGDALYEVTSGGHKRVYDMHFPPNYNPDKPCPLVIGLQGSAGDGNLSSVAKLNQWADKEGFMVVYPGAIGSGEGNSVQTWHGMYTHLMPNPTGVDDGRFIGQDMVQDLKNRGIKIEYKPFLFGFSNGGQLAQEINYRYPQEFGGMSLICAPKSAEQPDSHRPGASTSPVFLFYSDTDLPYGKLDIGSGTGLAREAARESLGSNYDDSYPTTVEYHRRNGGFEPASLPKESLNRDLTLTEYTNSQGQRMMVAHYHGQYAGHAMPGQPATMDMEALGEGSKIPINATATSFAMFKAELKRVQAGRTDK